MNHAIRRITGRHVLLGLFGFFGVMFAVNGVMVYFALTTFSGLETRDAYRSGLDYNSTIAKAEDQRRRGWKTTIDLAETRDAIDLTILDRHGSAVRALALVGRIGRPASEIHDRDLAFREVAPGRYRAAFAALGDGQWDLRVHTETTAGSDDSLRLGSRLWVK